MTGDTSRFSSVLGQRRVIAVVRHADPEAAAAVSEEALRGGIRIVEVTCSVPRAADLIARLCATADPEAVIGAGTVLTQEQARDVIAAGAGFVVSPATSSAVMDFCADAQVPVVPGVLTPSELLVALGYGVDTVKLFPADTVGPGHLKALASVFPDVSIVPTGGISVENAPEWITAGASAVGIGSVLNAAFKAGGRTAVADTAAAVCVAVGERQPYHAARAGRACVPTTKEMTDAQ